MLGWEKLEYSIKIIHSLLYSLLLALHICVHNQNTQLPDNQASLIAADVVRRSALKLSTLVNWMMIFCLLIFYHVPRSRANSCLGAGSDWNEDVVTIPSQVAGWLDSVVGGGGDGGVECRLYHPVTGVYTTHHASYEDQEYDKEERRLFTVGTFIGIIPDGLAWQSRTMRRLDGFIYGQVDQTGKFTGVLTFIYPDFLTGLRGAFVSGILQRARAVDVVGERCKGGMKELKLKHSAKDSVIVWDKHKTNATYIGQHPTVMDPHEKKSVYAGESLIGGAGEGIFANRIFSPGDLVSYYSGHKTYQTNIIHKHNMTLDQRVEAASYLYSIGHHAPSWWAFSKDLLLNIGQEYRDTEDYRTTLAHKANHDFSGNNVEWGIVDHPVVGGIACLVATEEIDEGDAIYFDYNYDWDTLVPSSYADAFKNHDLESRMREKYSHLWK